MSEIVDIKGKKRLNCSKCGLTIRIPPREISIEKINRMKDVKKISKLLKESISTADTASNVIILVCPNCNNAIICKDEFTQIQ
jgi:DNA-directed RNA polymerase subunit M/transcription elongation factor TFIIS